MTTQDSSEEPRREPSRALRFRLDHSTIFVQSMLAVWLVLIVGVWVKLQRNFPMWTPLHRLLAWVYFSTTVAVHALTVAGLTALVMYAAFRLVLSPLLVRWYHPRCRDPEYVLPLVFALGPGERIETQWRARLALGRRTVPGTLVRTNQRLCFYPFAWEVEPWALACDQLARVELHTPRRRVLNWITGYPDHVVVTARDHATTTLIVADPDHVLESIRIDSHASRTLRKG